MSTAPSPRQTASFCPLCGKPTDVASTPFCSRGCKDRDLVNWLSDAYRVPGSPAEDALQESAQDGLDSGR